MPAASNKVEQKASSEVQDPMKQVLLMLDKKVRNLEKRKGKLDAIESKAKTGGVLEKEQQDALKHYDEVKCNLEFARDLQKQMNSIAAEVEKQQKKQAKREKQERTASEVKRVAEILHVQNTLESLGSETVREHFKTGKHGAVVLTEDNLTQLDGLYQLINPPRNSNSDFISTLSTAADHIVSLLEMRERPVVGSTYKELHELISLVNGCGYFERASVADEAIEEVAEEGKEVPVVAEISESVDPLPPAPEDYEEIQPEMPVMHQVADLEENLSHSQVMPPGMLQEQADSFFVQTSTPTVYQTVQTQQPQSTRIRPLDEIVSSVQGTFNFLQESLIEVDSPHMDPAVVASQPMMRPPSVSQPQACLLPQSAYSSVSFSDHSSVSCDLQQTGVIREADSQDSHSLSQQNMKQSNLDFVSGQAFVQANLSHSQNLSSVSESMFPSAVEDASAAVTIAQQRGHGMISQQLGSGEPVTHFDLPPSIPLPHMQDGSQLTGQEKKFQMNASAPVFQSMYAQPPAVQSVQAQPPHSLSPPLQQSAPDTRPATIPPTTSSEFPSGPANFAQAAGDFSQAGNNFQTVGFPRGGRNGGPATYRGGQRGGRGASNNVTVQQNGFNTRPVSGNGRGGRGGSSYPGYSPRNEYRADGYQGYNNGFGVPGTFQKRGGAGAAGFPPRGSGNRGAAGMRGGAPRGGTGITRGSNSARGSLTRPVNAQ